MSGLIGNVSSLLHERTRRAAAKAARARSVYADGLLTDDGGSGAAEELVAAMDELGLDARDLAADANALSASSKLDVGNTKEESLAGVSEGALAAGAASGGE